MEAQVTGIVNSYITLTLPKNICQSAAFCGTQSITFIAPSWPLPLRSAKVCHHFAVTLSTEGIEAHFLELITMTKTYAAFALRIVNQEPITTINDTSACIQMIPDASVMARICSQKHTQEHPKLGSQKDFSNETILPLPRRWHKLS